MSDDTAIVLRALRCQRDRLLRMTDAALLAWEDPTCPVYAWFDQDAHLRDFRLRLAGLNAAIARRLR